VASDARLRPIAHGGKLINRLQARPYREDADLLLLQDLVRRCWPVDAPAVRFHPGDLSWRRYQHERSDWAERIRIWTRPDGIVEAFAWRDTTGSMSPLVAPDLRDTPLVDELIDWHVEACAGAALPVEIWQIDAGSLVGQRLADRGFKRFDDHVFEGLHRQLDDVADLAPSPIPMRGVATGDLAARVAVHRSAFHPSRVTETSYAAVMASPLYRPDLDVVAVAPDGSFAAYTRGWLDPVTASVELEPVGAHMDHRGRGFARAACAEVLRRAARGGAREAVVWSVVGNEPAARLYRSLGFRPVSRDHPWRRWA
jgi:ribosomal protein S18 acetylase RimI-like enzyme